MYSVTQQAGGPSGPDAKNGPSIEKANSMSRVFHPYAAAHELRVADDYRSLLADKDFIKRVIREVGALIEERGITTLSFDVFDTALMRSTHSEARRFHAVANQFAEKNKNRFTATDALVARAMAARAAYTFANAADDGTREGTMTMIAKITCAELGVPNMTNEYIKTELAFEQQHLSVNTLIVSIISAFPSVRTIFLSDMYLESPYIKKLLQKSFGRSTEVVSSADGFGSKRCGGLFGFAAKHFDLNPSNVLHFGDSLESDFRQAKRHGMQAYFLPISDAERTARKDCYRSLGTQLAPSGIKLESFLSFNC